MRSLPQYRSRFRKPLILGVILLGALGVALAWPVRSLLQRHAEKFTQVEAGVLYRSRQPREHMVYWLRHFGIHVVVNLRAQDEAPDSDRDFLLCQQGAEQAGARFVNLPVTGALPSDEQILEFLRWVDRSPPVLVHCHQGRSRTGLMVAAYGIVLKGWSVDQARQDMLDHGYHPDSHDETRMELLRRLHRDRSQWLQRVKEPPAAATQTRPAA